MIQKARTIIKLGQEAFNKMESIVQYAQKRAKAPEPILSKKRKSSLVVKERKAGEAGRRRKSGLKVARRSAKARAIPGGFGDEDEDEDEEEQDVGQRRRSKRPRLETEATVELEPQPSNSGETDKIIPDADTGKEEERKRKERELIRKRLEYNKTKRRSSMGRPSLAGRVPPARESGTSTATPLTDISGLRKSQTDIAIRFLVYREVHRAKRLEPQC